MPSTKANGRKYGISQVGGVHEVPLPSGNLCLVRSLGPEQLIQAGLLDSMDSLTAMVSDLHIQRVTKGKAGKRMAEHRQQQAVIDLIRDRKRWEGLQATLDGVLPIAVVEPEVLPPPASEAEREEGKLYADRVNLMDKITIFNAALGEELRKVQAMEPFRGESGEPVAGMGDEQDVPAATQPADGDRVATS